MAGAAGRPGRRQRTPPSGGWLTKWQTLVAAIIAGIAAVAAAWIGSNADAPSSGSSASASATDADVEVLIADIQISPERDAYRTITLTGRISPFDPAEPPPGKIYGFARPVDGGPVVAEKSIYWYVSQEEATPDVHGSWTTSILVGPNETRDLKITASIMRGPADIPGSGRARAGPDPSVGIAPEQAVPLP
ncbi:MAG: hypothetical protein ABWY29_07170 [Blastococcus sp.]